MKNSALALVVAAAVAGFASVTHAQTNAQPKKQPHPETANDATLQKGVVTLQPGRSYDGSAHAGGLRGGTSNATPFKQSTHSVKLKGE